jgi:hypothetical protein
MELSLFKSSRRDATPVFVTWNNNSYLIVNDASAGFQANSDLILNVTGFSGNFQTATVDTLFI